METTISKVPEIPYPHITVTQGLAGHFAVLMHWNTEDTPGQGFAEPWSSGIGRYKQQVDAIQEAISWAAAEELPYCGPALPDADPVPARQDVLQQLKELIPGLRVIEHGDGVIEATNDPVPELDN